MFRAQILSSLCVVFTIATVTSSPTPSSMIHKYRDSKISRIQPSIYHAMPSPDQTNAGNHMQSENDSTVKYADVSKFPVKYHKKHGSQTRKKTSTNHELLKSLGLSKIKTPPGHHRKRLAIESSRHHSRPDDSHMFIIKLPPNPYYYANSNTVMGKNEIQKEDKHQRVSSMGFKSNGKPGRIYHWNLPVLKKMLTKSESTGRKSSNLRHSNDVNELIDIKNIPTWSNPWDDSNESLFSGKQNRGSNGDGTSSHASSLSRINLTESDDDLNLKLLKNKSPTYYAPSKQKKKVITMERAANSAASSNKYFPGNGKPKSFYVIKKNQQHKPFYQKLIS